ncbi:hypothetical protein LG047_07025 [Methylocystis sp. WRRC1]|uniref:hypothetical protein n=1 Tax=unclassified Methylocystis TaxID=2625913 RepID=UPI0001F8860D|nr:MULTISPECIES: hypothetical protein [unclassified Methylocystis]MCC3245071.1 hypothetical protein [Methylocystis sp. WRRC1]
MPDISNKRQPQNQERSQYPLWFAIVGLVISIASYGMMDLMIGDVVFLFGAFCAVVGLVYWFLQPRHGL